MVEGLFVLGTSHRVSAIPLRERLQTEAPGVREALARLTVPGGALEEAALLATCGRFEIYGVARHPWRARRLLLRLARKAGVGPRAIEHHDLYFRQGASAAEHLFRVAGGLDSAVRGEAQILGQVRGVLTDELDDGTLGPKLLRLFQSAVACGKRVRAETKIGRGAASLAGAALQLLRRHERYPHPGPGRRRHRSPGCAPLLQGRLPNRGGQSDPVPGLGPGSGSRR